MQQAKIYWDMENYTQVEKIFRKSVEFCNEHEVWKLNVSHVLFMQGKYKEAIGFYEPIVKKNYDNVSFAVWYYFLLSLITCDDMICVFNNYWWETGIWTSLAIWYEINLGKRSTIRASISKELQLIQIQVLQLIKKSKELQLISNLSWS